MSTCGRVCIRQGPPKTVLEAKAKAKPADKIESGILRAIHESVAGLHRAALVDEPTMRKFDALCRTPVSLDAPPASPGEGERGDLA